MAMGGKSRTAIVNVKTAVDSTALECYKVDQTAASIEAIARGERGEGQPKVLSGYPVSLTVFRFSP